MTDWTFPALEYKRPDIRAEQEALRRAVEAVRAAKTAEEVFAVMDDAEQHTRAFITMYTIMYVRHTVDTSDAFYEAESDYFNEILPELTADEVAFNAALSDSPFRPDIEAKYGEMYFTNMDLQRRSFTEANIPLMQREAQLCDEYQKIMAGCAIEFEGEKRNLYGIQKFFEHEDRAVRAAAFRAYSHFYEENETRLEEIWDELVRIRNEMGRNLGFENFIPLGYLQQGRTDYGVAEVEAFREQVRTVLVPLCEELYEAQARRLGVERIMVYDESRIFPDGNAHPAGDDDFMIRQARAMYHDMSAETGEFIDFMIDHQLMDLKNKPHKAATGYCTELPSLLAPFVFSCFNGTIGDMQVLTHELGHAFAGYEAMKTQSTSAYFHCTTDIAEIHSMSMEQFAYPYAERFFGEDADKFRFAHLQEAITFVPFGVAVDEFQHICYAQPELTPKERTMVWRELEKKYMPWRRYEDDPFMERGGMWYHKLHIFLYPMYYINYTFTTIGAMEFRGKRAEDPARAWEDYMTLCKVGGSMRYLDTLAAAHLSVPFSEGAVERACAGARDDLLRDIRKMESGSGR